MGRSGPPPRHRHSCPSASDSDLNKRRLPIKMTDGVFSQHRSVCETRFWRSDVRPVCWHPIVSGNSDAVTCGKAATRGSFLRAPLNISPVKTPWGRHRQAETMNHIDANGAANVRHRIDRSRSRPFPCRARAEGDVSQPFAKGTRLCTGRARSHRLPSADLSLQHPSGATDEVGDRGARLSRFPRAGPDNGARTSEREVDGDDAVSGSVRNGGAIARRP
jgi:hypothetical protein